MTKYQVYMFAIKNFLYVVLNKSTFLFLNPFVPTIIAEKHIALQKKLVNSLINDVDTIIKPFIQRNRQ